MVATTRFYTGAAVLLAAARQVSAGSAIVHNQCPYPVYLWSISDVNSQMQTLSANGGQYSEAYQINPDGGGISMKFSDDTTCQNITQFEYTVTGDSLWYDLSNIDGYPFAQYGVSVVSSDTSCRGVSCPAGTNLCAAAYNVPSDNFATAECGSSSDTVIVLCSGETDTSGSPSITSVASQAASTASVVTVFPTSSAVATTAAATTSTVAVVPSSSVVVASSSAVAPATSSTPHPSHHHSTHSSVASSSAAPVVTAAAVVESSNNDPYLVIFTTFVTHVVTVQGRSAQPTAAAEAKRDVHHEHAAVHHGRVARRHQHPRAFAS